MIFRLLPLPCFSVWEIASILFSAIVSRPSHWLRGLRSLSWITLSLLSIVASRLSFPLSWVSTSSSFLCIETRKINWKAMHVKRQVTTTKHNKLRMRSHLKQLLEGGILLDSCSIIWKILSTLERSEMLYATKSQKLYENLGRPLNIARLGGVAMFKHVSVTWIY